MKHFLLSVILALTSTLVMAEEMRLHVIPRADAEALVPVIRPLLPEGGTVEAYRGRLILRTTPRNLAEVERVLGELSGPPTSLIVSLRRAGSGTREQQGTQVQIHSGIPGDSRGSVHVEQNRLQQQRRDHYEIRTLSGYPARISRGTLLSLSRGWQGHALLLELDQGIQVLPQLAPDGSVLLRVAQSFDIPAGRGIADTQRSATTLRVPLGEWTPMGRVSVSRSSSRHSLGGSERQRTQLDLPLEVMVRRAP